MRKGADCLSKWVGESERQLRLLFDQVNLKFPSHERLNEKLFWFLIRLIKCVPP